MDRNAGSDGHNVRPEAVHASQGARGAEIDLAPARAVEMRRLALQPDGVDLGGADAPDAAKIAGQGSGLNGPNRRTQVAAGGALARRVALARVRADVVAESETEARAADRCQGAAG